MRPTLGSLALALLLGTVPALASAQYHFTDSLRSGTSGNASGGTFGPDGWTVTGVSDRIWYPLPRLVSGSIEVTVANITPAVLPLADHEIFAMYEDGHGIGEPIAYSPAFRNNHYKMLLRIYGGAEVGRVGSMKMMWGMCPSGAPGYDACGCTSFFEEPFADPGPWTGAPVRIRVEWGGGHARLLRDGVEVVSVDWSGTGLEFGPSDLHMMIGSPRNDGGLSAMPLGATFSDLVVDGVEGLVATCPGGPVDAGVALDAGSCGTGGGAIADATAASWEPGVFADASDLNVEGDGAQPNAVVYLRFPAPGGPVTRATLTMHTASTASAGGGSGRVCAISSGSWDEATLTWANRPAPTTCTGTARTVGAGEAVSWDVTSLVAGGARVELAVVSTDGDGVHYLSRESGGCALGPTLDVEVGAASDAAVVVDAASVAPDGGSASDAGRSSDAASAGLDAGATTDAGGARGGPLASGCGCRALGGERGAPLGGLAALATLLVARRRRRRAH